MTENTSSVVRQQKENQAFHAFLSSSKDHLYHVGVKKVTLGLTESLHRKGVTETSDRC